MSKKNFYIIAATLAVIAAVAVIGLSTRAIRGTTLAPTEGDGDRSLTVASPSATYTVTPMTTASAAASATATATPPQSENASPDAGQEVRAYLLASVGGMLYEPIPLVGEDDYVITQKAAGMENVIHVTADSIAMASSTCDNQDCVKQGTVSLDNKDTRVLQNMIICLPNGVTLELLTPEEVEELRQSIAAEQ